MLVVHGTKKFLDRVENQFTDEASSTTVLGSWYATVLFWKPQVAFFMNENSFFPVLLPLAPSSTLLKRFPTALEHVLRSLNLDANLIEYEIAEMARWRIEKTKNRQVLGVMNDFSGLAAYSDITDPTDLSKFLAGTPCGPLRRSTRFPDLELIALAARTWPPPNP